MQTLLQKALIACLVVNTIFTCLLLGLGWKAYRTIEQIEQRAARFEALAEEVMRDVSSGKEKAVDAYKRYKQWRERENRENEDRR